MNLVKWIDNHDIELRLESDDVVDRLAAEGICCVKSSTGKRTSPGSVFVHYDRSDDFSPSAYEFNDNRELFEICMKLRKFGFTFWGTFKTERSPFDFMQYLQRTGQLQEPFLGVQAGKAAAQEIFPGQDWTHNC